MRVTQAGICETDLQLAKGYMGFQGVPGHEFVGVVQSGPYAGRRAVGEINCSCYKCSTCRSGRATHCPHRTVLGIDRHDGAFAQYLAIPHSSLHWISDRVTDDQAVLVEPLAAAFQITKQIAFDGSQSIAILGDGRLGYLCAVVLSRQITTGEICVVGKHQAKLQRFEREGIPTCLIENAEHNELPKKYFDVVVDCTGATSGLAMAVEMVRPRGIVVMKTTVAAEHQLSLAAIVIDEISVVGSRCGPFADALQAIESDGIALDDLVTHRFGLQQVEEAFRAAADPSSFKVVFQIGN